MPNLEIELPALHPNQRIVANDPAQFINLACGRRFGKSIVMGSLCYKRAIDAGGRAWWVYPNFPTSTPAWRFTEKIALQIREGFEGVQIRQVDRCVKLPGGAEVWIKSADDPTKLVAEGLVYVAVDECGIIAKKAWEESLRPTLIDHDGRAILGGVPKGHTWWHKCYLWGLDPEKPDWSSYNFSTFDNPTLPAKSVEKLHAAYAAGQIPERMWLQEHMGQFISDSGQVFRRVADAATAVWQDGPVEGHSYVFGVDWGKQNDFTVVTVWDLDLKHLVYLDRFNEIDYTLQVGRLKALHDLFRPVRILAEKNSMGDPLIEQLQRQDMPVTPFNTTGASKWEAVEALSLAIETGEVAIVPDDTLIGELQSYERKDRPSGVPAYSAPDGLHDDCVMSAVIGHAGVRTGEFGMIVL